MSVIELFFHKIRFQFVTTFHNRSNKLNYHCGWLRVNLVVICGNVPSHHCVCIRQWRVDFQYTLGRQLKKYHWLILWHVIGCIDWNVLFGCDRAVITYRVLIVNVRQSSISSCRPYLLLSGTLADTQPIYFSNERFEVLFQVGARSIFYLFIFFIFFNSFFLFCDSSRPLWFFFSSILAQKPGNTHHAANWHGQSKRQRPLAHRSHRRKKWIYRTRLQVSIFHHRLSPPITDMSCNFHAS